MKLQGLQSKGNSHQMEETACRMRENLCQLLVWQGINNQSIQGAQKTKLQKINDPLNKWANELKRHSKEEVQKANKHEEMLNTFHKGNANQKYIEIPVRISL
jgi:hypothetical protein